MKCKKYRELFPLYVLGELNPDEMKEIERHLKQCPDCPNEIEQLQDMIGILSEREAAELDEYEKLRLEKEVYKKLAVEKGAPDSFLPSHRLINYALKVAAVIVIFLLGYFSRPVIMQTTPDESSLDKLIESRYTRRDKYYSSLATKRFSNEGLKLIARGSSALAPEK